MRTLSTLAAATAIAFGDSAPAKAAPVQVSGSMYIQIGTLPPVALPIPATTVDVTGGVLSVPSGIVSTTGLFVPVAGFPLNAITGVIVTVSNGAGAFVNSGAAFDLGPAQVVGNGFGGQMPLLGVLQLKGLLAVNVPLSVVGAGGSVNAAGIVVEGAPWTTSLAFVTTTGPAMATYQASGYAVGALGAPSSTVVLVTPAHVNAAGYAVFPMFAAMNLHFVPEPGTALLLGAGLACLVALARRRMSN